MAPALLKAWKVKGGGGDKPNLLDMFFKCFLATESVRGTNLELCGITNKGSLEETGNILFMAEIGHKCEAPKFGKGIVTGCFLSCMLLLHFMSTTAS